MTDTSRPARAHRRIVGLVATAAALALTVVMGPAGTANAGQDSPPGAAQSAAPARTVDVMTRNLYLGAGLERILTALATGNNAAIVQAATLTWGEVVASDPEERMEAIADEIVEARPAVIGLQEVTTWTTYDYNPLAGTASNPSVAYDFLDLLLAALADRGVVYHEVSGATATNFGSDPIPIVTAASPTIPTKAVSLQDRDVILRRADVKAWNGQNGNFRTILKPPDFPITVDRGWGSADIRTKLAVFRFVNSHTEAFGPEAIRVGEVVELFAAQAAIAATDGALPTVYVGDYNSSPGEGGYLALRSQLDDAWVDTNGSSPGYTCCQDPLLDNTVSKLDERIDLILTTDGFVAQESYRTGITPIDLPGDTWWASDHAGVVASLTVD